MAKRSVILAVAMTLAMPALAAHDPDQDAASRAQERLDRDIQRTADRAADQAQRFAEERAKIDERAIRDPEKAAEDLTKLEADRVNEEAKISEDAAKAQEDYAKDAAKEAEDLAEDTARIDSQGSDHGSSEQIRDLGQEEGAEHDGRGFAVRRGEIVAIDLSPQTLAAAEARGFRVIERRHLESLDRDVTRLATPVNVSATDARTMVRVIDPKAIVDLVHYYGLGLTAGEKGRPIHTSKMTSPPRSGSVITVGVIDTAIARHAALGQSHIIPWSAGSLPGAPLGHGTAVASLVASEGRATIYSANIFRGTPERPFTSADVIADALEWMIAQGVPTINMSLAGPRNAILDNLIREARRRGHTIVAAAGNGGPSAPPAYPAAVSGVVAVTAVDGRQQVYRYANRGRYITVAARGVDVVAAHAPGGLARFSGTSFASPHVAAWIARCRAGGSDAAQCETRLRREARDLGTAGFDEIYGFGLVD
jgi:subtilisin family serine protease